MQPASSLIRDNLCAFLNKLFIDNLDKCVQPASSLIRDNLCAFLNKLFIDNLDKCVQEKHLQTNSSKTSLLLEKQSDQGLFVCFP